MKLIPVLTEKSMKLVKSRGYTFWVPVNLNKFEIKKIIEETFGVNVISTKTINYKGRVKKNNRGKVKKIKAIKKAIVFLKEKEKIDLFEEEKKPKTKKANKEKANK